MNRSLLLKSRGNDPNLDVELQLERPSSPQNKRRRRAPPRTLSRDRCAHAPATSCATGPWQFRGVLPKSLDGLLSQQQDDEVYIKNDSELLKRQGSRNEDGWINPLTANGLKLK